MFATSLTGSIRTGSNVPRSPAQMVYASALRGKLKSVLGIAMGMMMKECLLILLHLHANMEQWWPVRTLAQGMVPLRLCLRSQLHAD